jgi:hypothetical protein
MGAPEDAGEGRPVVATPARSPEEVQRLFDQYKLGAELADRLSARRGTANGFFFTVSSALLAASESLNLSFAAGAGMVLAATWWLQLRSYRILNSAKFTVLGQIEDELPMRLFGSEWKLVKEDRLDRALLRSRRLGRLVKPLARYPELSIVEQVVPAIFLVLFAVTLIGELT